MSFWKDYFTFSKRERSGILVLLSLILLVLTANQLVGIFYQNEIQKEFSKFQNEINEFEKGMADSVQVKNDFQKRDHVIKNKTVKLVPFDPNNASLEELIDLGFSQKLSRTVVAFRQKGGKFQIPEDLKKIYGMNDSIFNSIRSFVEIPDSDFKKITEVEIKNKKDKTLIDLNSADTIQLQLLNGIGSKLSKRIIIFRDALGGFYSIEQLKEVYGLKPEIIEKNLEKITISGEVKKININTCSAEELKEHPYIYKWNIANSIVNYRNLHGKYITIEDVKRTDLVNEDLYSKLAPYLTVE